MLGHIAHEEQPEQVTQVILREAHAVGVLPV
jgi:hypothetical protein